MFQPAVRDCGVLELQGPGLAVDRFFSVLPLCLSIHLSHNSKVSGTVMLLRLASNEKNLAALISGLCFARDETQLGGGSQQQGRGRRTEQGRN